VILSRASGYQPTGNPAISLTFVSPLCDVSQSIIFIKDWLLDMHNIKNFIDFISRHPQSPILLIELLQTTNLDMM